MEDKIIGIDLGTTFSAIAHIDEHGKPETILNTDNRPITASVVLFEGEDNIVVGQLAKDNAVSSPENVVMLVKREMGKDIKFEPAGKEFTPEEISAMILKKLKQDAEERFGHEINDAVITVPAYFGTAERKATQDAGEMAGFTVHHILNEPTAAALSYGFTKADKEQTVLVYDLGGGTFDITLLKITPAAEEGDVPKIEMISTGGNHDLGGANWDERIMEYVANQFTDEHGEDPRDELTSKQDLYIKCENAKTALSKVGKSRVVCQHAGQSLVVEVDREKLLELTEDLLQTTIDEMEMLLSDKEVTSDQIDQILLVGGSTRLLMVREMLEEKFPGKVNKSLDPDQCVGQGAAWRAMLIGMEPEPVPVPGPGGESGGLQKPGGNIIDVCSKALGVAAQDANGEMMIYPLIAKDTQLPCEAKDTFTTLFENQTSVELPIYQNDARDTSEVLDLDSGEQIGQSLIISGLPGGRPPAQPIEVTFKFDESFRLFAEAVDVNSGVKVDGELKVTGLDDNKKDKTGKMLGGTTIQS